MEQNKKRNLSSPLMEGTPKQNLSLLWKNVNVDVIDSSHKGGIHFKNILSNSTGYAFSGQTLAILGPSGAGKTTLLSLITKRMVQNRLHRIEGEILMNNKPYNYLQFSQHAAFILQNDILMETLTVRETIEFAAQMKLKGTDQEKQSKVDDIISKLKLEKCANSLVNLHSHYVFLQRDPNHFVGGMYMKGISGGERKRTNIGLELVTDPSLIVLDEPTSGLDSFTAFLIINLLKKLAKTDNKTIIFTIHQPSSEIYNTLDRVMLLRNGATVFQGNSKDVMPYLERFNVKIPEYCNPADFFMELLTQSLPDPNTSYILNASSYEKHILPSIELEMKLPCKVKSANTFIYEVALIAKRSYRHFYRSPVLLRAKIVQLEISKNIVSIGFLTATLWWRLGNKQPEDTQDNIDAINAWVLSMSGLLFFYGAAVFMNILMTLVMIFPAERLVFLKEENSNSYRVSSYFFGKMLVEIPYVIIYPILQNVVVYWLLDLRRDGFWIFTLILVLMSLNGNGIGLTTGSMFSESNIAMALTPMLLLPFMMFSGFFSNLNQISPWISWIQYGSPFRYMLNAMMVNQFDGITFGGVDPVETYGYNLTIWEAIGVIALIAFLFHAFAFLFLKIRAKMLY